jgi:hypothetical protein
MMAQARLRKASWMSWRISSGCAAAGTVQQREGLLHDPPVGAQAGTMVRATSGDHRVMPFCRTCRLPPGPAAPGSLLWARRPSFDHPAAYAARGKGSPCTRLRRQPAPLILMAPTWTATTRPGKMHSRGEGNGPGMARSVCGGALHRQGRFAFPFGNDLRPPLTAGVSAPLRSETEGQTGACPDRMRAIPCTVRAVTKGGAEQGRAPKSAALRHRHDVGPVGGEVGAGLRFHEAAGLIDV